MKGKVYGQIREKYMILVESLAMSTCTSFSIFGATYILTDDKSIDSKFLVVLMELLQRCQKIYPRAVRGEDPLRLYELNATHVVNWVNMRRWLAGLPPMQRDNRMFQGAKQVYMLREVTE